MKHAIINIIGLFLFLLGLPMAADTAWGWVLMAVPVIYWILMFMILIHKSLFAAIVFWSAVAYIQWQVALVAVMAFILFVGIRSVYRYHTTYSDYYGDVDKTGTGKYAEDMQFNPATSLYAEDMQFNPATDLPMMDEAEDMQSNPSTSLSMKYADDMQFNPVNPATGLSMMDKYAAFICRLFQPSQTRLNISEP